jgi:hypothetical protein
MLVAHGPNRTTFTQLPWLAADFASTAGFVCGDSDALTNRFIPTTVHVKTQAAKFLFHLQDFKLGAACRFEFGH